MTLYKAWTLVTDFGDSAVAVPTAVAVFALLVASRWRQAAIGWFAAVAGCALVLGVFKLAFKVASGGCGADLLHSASFSPSGHSAMSAVVFGGLAVLGSRHMPEMLKLVVAIATSSLVCTIGASRVALHAHKPLEVIVGLAVGAGGVALLAVFVRNSSGPRWLTPAVCAAAALVIALLYGTQWPVEDTLHRIAYWIKGATGLCSGQAS